MNNENEIQTTKQLPTKKQIAKKTTKISTTMKNPTYLVD
jgi:hypothetical protein